MLYIHEKADKKLKKQLMWKKVS